MIDQTFYVYALKDPRRSPAMPFYIGKGTGVRAYDHLAKPDDSRKGKRIQEIRAAGQKVLVATLVEGVDEAQSLKLEAELISAFGTEDSGGMLTNVVMPSGLGRKSRRAVVVPHGVREKTQLALNLMKSAILEMIQANERGVSNADIASLLGLRSDYGGGSKDYLSYSLLGLLMRDGKIERLANSRKHVARVQ